MINRRIFFRQTSAWALGLSASFIGTKLSSSTHSPPPNIIYPKALFSGARIGVISPSSSLSRENFFRMIDNFSKLGFEMIYTDNLRVKKGFLAGTDHQRLDDLHRMFEDDSIDGIICSRGGYGAGRLLNDIDFELIAKHPKVFIGYSDITALLLAIHKQTGLVCFHGPNGDSTYSIFSEERFRSLILEKEEGYQLSKDDPSLPEEMPTSFKEIHSGVAKGPLIGGNLTLISTLMGTPYEADFEDRIVFLEDIGESPYRIDRMLTQLLLAGKFEKARGIMLGNFVDCEVEPEDPDFPDSFSLEEVISERLGRLNIPVVMGMPFGHIKENGILPLGVEAELDAGNGTLTLMKAAVK